MTFKIIKYSILTLLGAFTFKRYFYFGDYCLGMADGLAWILFVLIFLSSVIIYLMIDLYRKKFDKYVLIIFSIVVALNAVLLNEPEPIFSKKIYLEGIVQSRNYREKYIELYENKTFKIEMKEVEWSCYFQGKYDIRKDSLILIKENLSAETDNYFTNNYKIDLKNKVLLPYKKEFDTIKISNTND